MTVCALRLINDKYADQVAENGLLQALKQRLESRLSLIEEFDHTKTKTSAVHKDIIAYENIYTEIITEQRNQLQQIGKKDGVSDGMIKKYLLALDQEEEKLKQDVGLL
jgi:cell shape-determining protein MreC